jgi:hypothetical protein
VSRHTVSIRSAYSQHIVADDLKLHTVRQPMVRPGDVVGVTVVHALKV